uniref:zinc finger protein 414 n=1 Tax=Panthera onca TaxID=9690 RepID=UPI002952B998|nr:zinc finger protein 414 [Panthera onca]
MYYRDLRSKIHFTIPPIAHSPNTQESNGGPPPAKNSSMGLPRSRESWQAENGADVSASPRPSRESPQPQPEPPESQEQEAEPGRGWPRLCCFSLVGEAEGKGLDRKPVASFQPLWGRTPDSVDGGRVSDTPSTSVHPSGKQIPCSSPGCCLSFPSVRDLAQHLRTHCPPTQSLEGKLFRCSALSCTETFPTMQELVAHGKLHYKPNRYFKCENCLLRFRTHRSLFKHLHVCAEHAQSPAPPPPPALDKEPPAPERPQESDAASAPGLPFPLLEPFTTPAPAPTGPFLPYLNPAPFGLTPPRLRPFLAAAPGPPASSAAVWKKSQGAGGSPRRPQGGSDAPSGHAAPSRIVWEHTRGRYSCMQCAFSTASRPAMTLHLEDHRPIAPAAPAPGQPRPDAPPDPAPLAPKVSPLLAEGECPVFSPF